jgi:hypothetical protein
MLFHMYNFTIDLPKIALQDLLYPKDKTVNSGYSGHLCPLSFGPCKAGGWMNQSLIDHQSGLCPEVWAEFGRGLD